MSYCFRTYQLTELLSELNECAIPMENFVTPVTFSFLPPPCLRKKIWIS